MENKPKFDYFEMKKCAKIKKTKVEGDSMFSLNIISISFVNYKWLSSWGPFKTSLCL